MSRQETWLAAATILQSLAKGEPRSHPSPYNSPSSNLSSNGSEISKFNLPGEDSTAKQAFENELAALARRIKYLESKAGSVHQTLPVTPKELSLPSSPFDSRGITPISRHSSSGVPVARHGSTSLKSSRVSDLLAVRISNGESNAQARTVSEEDIDYLCEHVQRQAEEIKTQKAVIASVSEELQEHNTMLDQLQVFGSEVSRVAREVGTEGILGGQAQIAGVQGIWKELTDNGELHIALGFRVVTILCPFVRRNLELKLST